MLRLLLLLQWRADAIAFFTPLGNNYFAAASLNRANAHMIFSNPLAEMEKKMAEMLGPMDGPISVAKGNFARPTWDATQLRELSTTPPVYVIDKFLSDAECDACREAAETGCFPAVPYGAKNKIFTGTKWAAHQQHESVDVFLERTCQAFGGLPGTRFDPVTVTRYARGEYQAKHLDARLPHQINRNAAYMASGGQRIAQLICYLEAPTSGGCTKFFGPAFKGLEIPPKKGSALIFPTATLAGLADERYLHSGEPVESGTKYIVGTWLMEADRTDAKQVANAIDELWKLEGRSPPPRRNTAKKPQPIGANATPPPKGKGKMKAKGKGKGKRR